MKKYFFKFAYVYILVLITPLFVLYQILHFFCSLNYKSYMKWLDTDINT